ncbi:MAG: hypothetical protein HW387_1072 [Parachlamydiales bacterium]|nr:hypothetical protein [Parachlamydiales bacterium]
MKITIAQRYRPYSHDNGAMCLIPRTCWAVQAFPAMIRLQDLGSGEPAATIEIPLALHGLFREFTIQQDLEKGCVFIWGIAREGRYRLRLEALMGKIKLSAEKTPDGGIAIADRCLQKNESISWDIPGPFRSVEAIERLSLGSHRSQDWADVWRRMDLSDILPILFHLSQWTPIAAMDPEQPIARLWEEFLRAGFGSILVPRLQDPEYQGLLSTDAVPANASPCALISYAGEQIRKRFVEQDQNCVSILPSCEFTFGRFTDIQLPGIGTVDLEWAKGTIQCMSLRASVHVKVCWRFSPSIQSYRLRENLHGKGIKKSVDVELELEAGKNYYLDRFQK